MGLSEIGVSALKTRISLARIALRDRHSMLSPKFLHAPKEHVALSIDTRKVLLVKSNVESDERL